MTQPTQNLHLVESQIAAAHAYRNRLCELELMRRDAFRKTLRRLSPEYVVDVRYFSAIGLQTVPDDGDCPDANDRAVILLEFATA